MRRGQPVPPSTLAKAYRAYLDLGTLTAAAAAVAIHPKTLAKHARREKWSERRARIQREAAARADEAEIDRLAAARLAARYQWRDHLAAFNQPAAREGLLAILRELLHRNH